MYIQQTIELVTTVEFVIMMEVSDVQLAALAAEQKSRFVADVYASSVTKASPFSEQLSTEEAVGLVDQIIRDSNEIGIKNLAAIRSFIDLAGCLGKDFLTKRDLHFVPKVLDDTSLTGDVKRADTLLAYARSELPSGLLKNTQSATDYSKKYGSTNVDTPVSACPFSDQTGAHDQDFVVEVFTDEDLPIPKVSFCARLETGEVRNGITGDDGTKTLTGVPPNKVLEITYDDPDDVRNKAIAVRLNNGITQSSFSMVAGALREPPSVLLKVSDAYSDLFGADLVEVCQSAFSPDTGLDEIAYLLALGGLDYDHIALPYDDGR